MTIEKINSTPPEELRFRHFKDLRVGGRDELSNLKLAQLQERTSAAHAESIRRAFPNDNKSQATALRWLLRGLLVPHAIRKVKTDLEISGNATGRYSDYDESEYDYEPDYDEEPEIEPKTVAPTPIENGQHIDSYVAGANFYGIANAHIGLVQLVAEPENPHDPKAIRIEQDGMKLGYVPAALAPSVGGLLRAEILDTNYPYRLRLYRSIFEPFRLLEELA